MDRTFVVAAMIIALTSWVPHGPAPAVAEEPPADASASPKFSADQIDQMVGHALPLGQRRLRGANVHPAVDLA